MRTMIAALILTSASSLFVARTAQADCAAQCDDLLCSDAEQDRGLVRATILSVSPGEYPGNHIYDAIEVEVTSMESARGNGDWVGQRFTFRQAGWLETRAGDEISFWAPNQMQEGASLRPDIFLISNGEIVCERDGVASISAVAAATDLEACYSAFSQLPELTCDDTAGLGCSAASAGAGGSTSTWWLLGLGLLAFYRGQRR